jgi:hypothetical protein
MRKLLPLLIALTVIFSACSKTINGKPGRNPVNEPPVIKIISANNTQTLRPLELLRVKALMTDIDLVAVSSWEALNAAVACGPNPYKGSFSPMTYDYELEFSFTIPPDFPGEHVLRLYGVDASGNIATLDIKYRASN